MGAREVCGHSPAGKSDVYGGFGLNDTHCLLRTQTAAHGQQAGSPGKDYLHCMAVLRQHVAVS